MIRTLALLLLLTSCFREPTLDTSSESKFKESIQNIEKTLEGKELSSFRENVSYLTDNSETKKICQGKNAEEIDILIKNEIKEFNISFIKSMIEELEQEKIAIDKTNEYFYNLNIVKSSVRNKESIDITIEIENKTLHTLGGIKLEGVVKPTGRKMPWGEKSYIHHFAEGLEPKEKATFKFNLHKNYGYGKVAFPTSYDLQVSIDRVWDYKRETIYPSTFSSKKINQLERDKQELAELLSKPK